MRWANKSVQNLNYNYLKTISGPATRGPLLRPLDLGLRRPGTQSELEIWALGRGTIRCRVKGDVTMTNWSMQERDSLRVSASTLSQ